MLDSVFQLGKLFNMANHILIYCFKKLNFEVLRICFKRVFSKKQTFFCIKTEN